MKTIDKSRRDEKKEREDLERRANMIELLRQKIEEGDDEGGSCMYEDDYHDAA